MNRSNDATAQARPDWLVGAPSQWEIAPIKAKVDVRNGATPSSGEERFWEGDIPWATPVDLGVSELRHTGRYITREGYESCGTSLVPAGSVIVSTRAPIGSLALAGVSMCFNQGCRGLVPGDGVNGRFLYYALSAFSDVLQVYGEGTTFKELSSSSLSDFPIAWPPLDEQLAIASYLDAETARIDGLIEEKQKLRNLLVEMRVATITDAVSGMIKLASLDLSDIGGWKLARLRFKARVNPRATLDLDSESHVSFLPMDAIGDDGNLNLDGIRRVAEVSSGYTYFEEGDVSIAKITPCFENGKGAVMAGLVGGAGFGTTELIILRPEEDVDARFLYYVTQSSNFRKIGEAAMLGSGGQKRVPDLFVKDFEMHWPPHEDQVVIATYIDAETKRLDRLMQHVDEEILLLKELRSATITDAVLGRIDVREHMKH